MENSTPPSNQLTWVIGGAQGSGVDSAANIFSRACAQGGLHIFGKREYYSNIKGEHSYFTVRVSDNPIRSHVDEINILVSFDAETVFKHADKVTKGGAIIYDSGLVKTNINEVPTIDKYAAERISKTLENSGKDFTIQGMLNYAQDRGVFLYGISYFSLVKEFSQQINEPSLSKLTRMINVMALSASMAALNFDREVLAKAIRRIFKSKQKIAEINVAAADYAYNHMRSKYDTSKFPFNLNCKKPASDILLIQGNQSSAMGKIVAGCRFQTYYPITPASDDSEFLESNQEIKEIDGNKGSIVVVQTEDEIAAIAMAIGGALTGVRAATATSGPGFSLMAEALGWAGINEVPLVVSLYQRTGPSTGLPTRHEQGDLMFAINAGHGEFPRIVYASGDIEESFYDTIRVFNLAEIYQLPVIHMLDKAIANSIMTCKALDQTKIPINRGKLLPDFLDNHVNKESKKDDGGYDTQEQKQRYLRFKLDSSPISPRAILGTENTVFWNSGDEHTEDGHITEDPVIRTKMMNKRMSKLDVALNEITDDDKLVVYDHWLENHEKPSPDIDMVIISWGSTKGAILDAIDKLRIDKKEIRLKFIQLKLLHPFPTQLVEKMIGNGGVLIDVEMNYTSQLAIIFEQNISRKVDYRIVKYNGRPMSSSEIYNALLRIHSGDSPRRIILEHGT
ncbi:MAG TPA: 2-oxoacid:ferredoxin oxidoreductase subunit alpha [Nitrososphaeraceae archaeon]|nr:2-oxoacid:ferredoxin oxidoreductase subunit alpha [Nitrososphaeraceae archaeon]